MAMKYLVLLIALAASACNNEPRESAASPESREPDEVLVTQAPKSSAPLVLPMPKDQAELDRMILAGYTPHGNHLHPPGVKKCPLAQEGNEAVM
jgi:hypothetical protein